MSFALLLDIVIMFLLAGTVYYCWRLSEQLARFRQNRTEMDRLVRDLNAAVDRANKAILGLRETAQTSGEDLHKVMRTATELSDELQLMNEAANALATRLENAAAKGRADVLPESVARAAGGAPAIERAPAPSVAIRDPEFDGTADDDRDLARANDDDWGSDDQLQSSAERELLRALQKTKKTTRSLM